MESRQRKIASIKFPVNGPIQIIRNKVFFPPLGFISQKETPDTICSNGNEGEKTQFKDADNGAQSQNISVSNNRIMAAESSQRLKHAVGRTPPLTRITHHHHERIARMVEQYIDSELCIMSDGHDRTGAQVPTGPLRLAVFRDAFRLLLPYVERHMAAVMERCIVEYEQQVRTTSGDRTLPDRSFEPSLVRERARLEEVYRSHYNEVARAKQKELDQRQAHLAQQEATLQQRVSSLEAQLEAAKEESFRLRSQMSDDTERLSAMAQSVVEARLAANKAEISMNEMRERFLKVKAMEKVYTDLLQDHRDMMLLLNNNNIRFTPRVEFSMNELLKSDANKEEAKNDIMVTTPKEAVLDVYGAS